MQIIDKNPKDCKKWPKISQILKNRRKSPILTKSDEKVTKWVVLGHSQVILSEILCRKYG